MAQRIIVVFLIIGVIVGIGVGWVIKPVSLPAKPLPAKWTTLKEVATPFKGITISGISESTGPSKAVADLIPEFESITGIHVDLTLTSWDEMYSKAIADMVAGEGIYDFVYVEQDIVAAYLAKGWLTDITKFLEDNPGLKDPEYDWDDLLPDWLEAFKDAEGHVRSVPFEGFLKTYTYRSDIFGDPDVKDAFKAEYGWDLRPATTWEEYLQIAEFFEGWGKDKTPVMHGHSAQVEGVCLPYTFVETYWPGHGIWWWGISPDTMRASVAEGGTLNSPMSTLAVERFIELLDYSPPGVRTFDWGGAAGAIATETAVQGLVYGDQLSWVAGDPTKSKVIGKVKVTLPPTAPGVMDAAKVGKGYIGYYDGGGFSIPYSSKHKEAAWLFIQYVTRKKGADHIAEKGFGIIRKSTLDKYIGSELDVQTGYFTLFRDKRHLFGPAPKYPFHKVLIEGPLYINLHSAVAGDITPDEATAKMASEIDDILAGWAY